MKELFILQIGGDPDGEHEAEGGEPEAKPSHRDHSHGQPNHPGSGRGRTQFFLHMMPSRGTSDFDKIS